MLDNLVAGQDDYDRLRQLSYQSAEVIILCFSLSHESSLENALSKYYPEMQACCPHVPFILVGVNSQPRDGCDMERSENPHPCVERSNLVAMEGRGVAAAAKLGASGYYYCCPSSGEGVDTVIRVAALCTQLAKKGGPPKSIFRRMRGIPKLILRALGLAPPKSPPRLSECIVDNGNVYTDTDTAAVSVSVAAEESAARSAQDIYLEEITDVLLLSSESELNLCNDDPGVA
jgi:hypothetical protein